MPLINCKVEVKLRWTKHCVSSALGSENGNANADSDKCFFTIKDTNLNVPAVTKSPKDNHCQNFLAKDLNLFVQTKMVVLKDLIAKRIIYQKVLSKIIASSSMEKTFTTNPLILK